MSSSGGILRSMRPNRITKSFASEPPIRIFFAFDPRRVAILLIGGDKSGDKRFYRRLIAVADRFYGEHLANLEK